MLLDIDGIVRYSDEMNRVHYGEVVLNEDPKKLGRVKCKIEFLLEGSNDDLPWIYPNESSPTHLYVPQVGDKLKIVFRNGDIYHPEYIGNYHSTENHDPTFDADYPNTFGIHTKGFKALYNIKTEILEISTPNGSSFKMNKDGDTLVDAKGKFGVTSEKDMGLTTKGKLAVTSDGDMDLTTKGKFTVKATGKVSVTSDGEAEFFGKSKTTIGSASSQTIVNGTQVMLGGPSGQPVAVLGSQSVGIGNMGSPVVSNIVQGSSKVMAAP